MKKSMENFFVNLLGYLNDVNQVLTSQKCFHIDYDLFKNIIFDRFRRKIQAKFLKKTRIGFISEDTAQIELVKKTNLKRNGILQYDMNFCQHQNHHNKDIANYRFS